MCGQHAHAAVCGQMIKLSNLESHHSAGGRGRAIEVAEADRTVEYNFSLERTCPWSTRKTCSCACDAKFCKAHEPNQFGQIHVWRTGFGCLAGARCGRFQSEKAVSAQRRGGGEDQEEEMSREAGGPTSSSTCTSGIDLDATKKNCDDSA